MLSETGGTRRRSADHTYCCDDCCWGCGQTDEFAVWDLR